MSNSVHKAAEHFKCLSRRLTLAAVVREGFYRHKRQSARDHSRCCALYIALSLFAHCKSSAPFLKVYGSIFCKFAPVMLSNKLAVIF